MESTRFAVLFHKYLQGTISPKELGLLKDFVQDETNAAEYDRLLEQAYTDPSLGLFSGEGSDEIWHSFRARIINPSQSVAHRVQFLKMAWLRYAAVIILFLGIATYFWVTNNSSTKVGLHRSTSASTLSDIAPGSDKAILILANGQQIVLDNAQGNIVKQGGLTVVNRNGKLDYEGVGNTVNVHTLSTPRGGQYQLVLPDGSKAWLNAASSITYPTVFTGKDRTVSITGEVYFEVENDRSKTFHVKTGKEEITVLGTHFNVNAYSNEEINKTTLLEGAIKIGNVIVKPGQAYMNGKIVATNIEQDISWKNGFFNFENLTLPQAMRQVERWYNIEVVYEGKVPGIQFLGELNKNVSLSVMLEGLKGVGIHFRREGERKLVILP